MNVHILNVKSEQYALSFPILLESHDGLDSETRKKGCWRKPQIRRVRLRRCHTDVGAPEKQDFVLTPRGNDIIPVLGPVVTAYRKGVYHYHKSCKLLTLPCFNEMISFLQKSFHTILCPYVRQRGSKSILVMIRMCTGDILSNITPEPFPRNQI